MIDRGGNTITNTSSESQIQEAIRPTRQPRQIVLSVRRVVISLLVLLIFTVWIFALGVMVGRGTIFKNEQVRDLEKSVIGKMEKKPPQVTVEGAAEKKGKEPVKLTFYKSLTEGETKPTTRLNVAKEKPVPVIPQKALVKSEPKPVSVQHEKSSDPQAAESVSRLVQKQSPPENRTGVVELPDAVSQAPAPIRKAGDNFTIQVAAVPTREQAQKVAADFTRQGYQAYFYHVQHKSNRYFRVRVGPFENLEKAKQVESALKKAGHRDLFISRLQQ